MSPNPQTSYPRIARPYGGAGLEIERDWQTAHFTSGESVRFIGRDVFIFNRDGSEARPLTRTEARCGLPHLLFQYDNGAVLYMYANRSTVTFPNGACVAAVNGQVDDMHAPPEPEDGCGSQPLLYFESAYLEPIPEEPTESSLKEAIARSWMMASNWRTPIAS